MNVEIPLDEHRIHHAANKIRETSYALCVATYRNASIFLLVFTPAGPTGPTGPGGPTMMRGAEVDLGGGRSSEEEEEEEERWINRFSWLGDSQN